MPDLAAQIQALRDEIAEIKRKKIPPSQRVGCLTFRPDWPLRHAVIAECKERGISVHAFLKELARQAVMQRLNDYPENPNRLPVHHKPTHFDDRKTNTLERDKATAREALARGYEHSGMLIEHGAATASRMPAIGGSTAQGMLAETAGARFPGSIVPKAPNPSRKG